MNAIQALNLRKPDTRNSSAQNYPISAETSSRFGGKKSNIKEMLIRNFFRQYPIALDTPDLDQLAIERNVG